MNGFSPRAREQWAVDLPQRHDHPIWLHACSVGEINSIAPLIRALLARNLPIHLTMVTKTGREQAERLFGGRIGLSYLPWDVPFAFSRFLDALHPRLLLLIETEFWPGMLRGCARRGVPVVGINTRISDRSFPRYQRTAFFWRALLGKVQLFLAQSEIDSQRLQALGLDAGRIRVVGNLKYTTQAPVIEAESVRRKLDPSGQRPLLLLASSHSDEELLVLKMVPRWRQVCPDLLPVLVPRHPQRFDEVAQLLADHGQHFARLSQGEAAGGEDMLLVDAMGVLPSLYTVAELVIIGGTLVNVGGHNPLESAVCGRGVITGPHIQNFREMMNEMQRSGAAIVCGSTTEVEQSVSRLLRQPNELRQLNGSAALFMQQRGGVLERVVAEIEPWLA